MANTIRLGISTCPNDTFAFHALMQRKVDWQGLNFEVELLDIQELNHRLKQGQFDVAKASFYAAIKLSRETWVLPCGAALGFGVGPLLLAAKPNTHPLNEKQVTLCPGQDTTANLLFQLFYPHSTLLRQVLFSNIMPCLQQAQADFGVCIHEGRFTWQLAGLNLVEDLGSRWEKETCCPLPLGGILAKRSINPEVLRRVVAVISDSIAWALRSPEQTLPTMRKYAQEFDDRVLMQHVELYVNRWTQDLGEVGRRALQELGSRAAAARLIPQDQPLLTVFE